MAQIVYQGTKYPVLDPLEWTLAEASFIRKRTGQRVAEIGPNATLSDPEAIAALIYVAKKRAGEKVRWEDFEEFTVGECEFIRDGDEVSDDDDPDGGEDAAPDPTSPSGTTHARGNSTTSTRSRSSSTSTRGKSKS